MIQVVLYTLSNEQTSRLVLIHAYETVEDIPSELQANARLLDEAFPALTIDLKFVAGSFSPSVRRRALLVPPACRLRARPC